ncbi:MAG: hypothetical protein H0U66_14575 [Gemmatimonadaceae bacterium]|nr:hypothetical protein [Gemmatimonadaceae bacterium]
MTTVQEQARAQIVASDAAVSSENYTVLVEEGASTSAPSLTLAKALRGLGRAVITVVVRDLTRREWLRVLRSAEAIVVVRYHAIPTYFLSQLAMAVALDVPVVRWWVGSDVLNVLEFEDVRRTALRLDGIVSTNVAVAPHLVSELASVGISAELVPSPLDPELATSEVAAPVEGVRPVLTYLPGKRKDFFGFEIIEQVVKANPDLHFIIVADHTHALASYPNVESLGWVEDMKPLYARAGCILRITEHDGLPRMLIEGMLRGMYAIYSWPLEGSWQARTREEVQMALERYRGASMPNVRGRDAMLQLLDARPDVQMSNLIASASVPVKTRARALSLAMQTKIFPERFT